MKYSKYSAIIVGSGISGLFLANKLAESSNLNDGILLITKDKLNSGSSPLAQGGIVSVIPEINKNDSIESHIKDTIKAGCGLNDLNTVKLVSEKSAIAAQELIRYGVEFDKNDSNSLNFTLEGAHSCPRILHAKGDSTGRVIEEALCCALLKTKNVDIYENAIAAELLVDDNNECKGLIVFNKIDSSFEAVYSSNVILATGGIGQIYKTTTNPAVSTGDGIALAYKAGAEVKDMEFVQFHPTALFCKNKKTLPLVSESARGEGAKLVDLNGDYFAKNHHHLADLAPRDVVARAINQQILENDFEYVNLDISQIGIEKFKKRFPTITSLCLENDIDLSKGLIPVAPAEHYFMGGIKVDLNSRTTIKNLYAIGECSSTGLHGANRLASNSLLECVVFANKLAELICANGVNPPKKNDEKIKKIIEKYAEIDVDYDNKDEINELFLKLKESMNRNVGIVRNINSLNKALFDIKTIELRLSELNLSFSFELYELKNAICVAKLVAKAALSRNESIGAHFRDDYKDNKNIDLKGSLNYDKILVK
ncbi:MAG: L-aspartate oxidase [Candidatus Gastranaerophilales bacterium]|nr:L-aspartate oxidase [Candidatus Gastranaerophilales bacterium]